MELLSYRHNGQREQILCFGEANLPTLLFIPPFFEEANRLRHLVVSVMRDLVEHGFRTALPDLPGTGESLVPISSVRLADWRVALKATSAVLSAPLLVVSFRSGALIDDAADGMAIWRCAPENGDRLVRDLKRTNLLRSKSNEAPEKLILAGHSLTIALLEELEQATPASLPNVRTARLTTDVADADVRLEGSPLWRRSEPGDDPALQKSIIDDLLPWAQKCVSS